MGDYKGDFIRFLLKERALEFGERTLKSGRTSPYFLNTGLFHQGENIFVLGDYYAEAIKDKFGSDFDVVFGPAYKGIPLAVATAIALAKNHGMNKHFAFNRKEAKAHGEKGIIVGHAIKDTDRAVIVDDVFTTGDTKYEAIEIIKENAQKARIMGLFISLDRMETDAQGNDAVRAFEDKTGVPVVAIASIKDLMNQVKDPVLKEKIEEYHAQYGVKR